MKGYYLPAKVARSRFTPATKLVYSFMLSESNSDSEIKIKHKEIASALCLTTRTVRGTTRILLNSGLIEIIKVENFNVKTYKIYV